MLDDRPSFRLLFIFPRGYEPLHLLV